MSVRMGVEYLIKLRNVEHLGLGLRTGIHDEETLGEFTVQLLGGTYLRRKVLLEKSTNPKYPFTAKNQI